MNIESQAYHQTEQQITEESYLIQRAQKDPAAFAPLYKKYFEQIFYFVLKRVEAEETAADICSQVFLKALSNLGKYKSVGLPFGSWLYRIARNEIYDQHKKNKVGLVLSIESESVQRMAGEWGTELKADYSNLYQALKSLSEEEMELMELRFFEGRAFKEVGEILEITENNAKVKTYRVLDKLKKLMQDEQAK